MENSPNDALITMTGIAELAQVQRPVVSTWRQRTAVGGQHAPFPPAVDDEAGIERFRIDDVVDWLERTGRGNNPDPRSDAMAHVAPPSLRAPEINALDAVTAMLCLSASTGEALSKLSDADIVDLADEADPDDEVLFREIDALDSDRVPVAAYVDRLVDAAYHASGALDRILARRWTRTHAESGVTLAQPAHELVGDVSAALALDLDVPAVMIVDATRGGNTLPVDVVRSLDERIDASVLIAGDADAARQARRIARIRGYHVVTDDSLVGPAVVVAQFPHRVAPNLGAPETFEALDDIQQGLDHGRRAVIVGPAALLCDPIAHSELDLLRDAVVRRGALRSVLRLPRGLVPDRSRQALGLWVLSGEDSEHPEHQRIAVADLVNAELTPAVIDDVVSDVVAATKSADVARAHAFRVARWIPRARVLTGRGSALVPSGATHHRGAVAGKVADRLVRIAEITEDLRTARGLDAASAVHVEASSRADLSLGTITLGEAVRRGWMRSLPGSRVDDAALIDGTVRLIRPIDLDPALGSVRRSVDVVDLESRHPRVRRTEPGDVVFCATPRPRAVVDQDGMSVAVSPARILRCDRRHGLVPEVLARSINIQPAGSRDWRAWSVPIVPSEQVGELSAALRAIDEGAAESHRRLRLLAELTDLIIDRTAIGAVTVQTLTTDAEKGQ